MSTEASQAGGGKANYSNAFQIWNLMYHDMKALYTLEQLVNNHYCTRGIEQAESEGEK